MLEFLLALLTAATVACCWCPCCAASCSGATGWPATPPSIATSSPRSSASAPRARCDAEADAARTEIERRLLAAADSSRRARGRSRALAPFLLARPVPADPAASRWPLPALGQPGLPAAPFAVAPPARLAGPTVDVAAGDRRSARTARRQPDDAGALSALGEALTHQADGVVTPEAQACSRRALEKNAGDPRACSISAWPRRRPATAARRSSAGARSSSARRPMRRGCRPCAPR
jgi:hypothetical protein